MEDLDPQSQAIVDGLNGTGILPFAQRSPAEARSRMLGLRVERALTLEQEVYKVSGETIRTADGSFNLRILQPRAKGEHERMPAVIYFHGGGFFAGSVDQTDLIVRQIARDLPSW